MPDWDTIRIHGLREVDLEEAPPLDDLLDRLLEALTGRPIVAHVAAVERSFLGARSRRTARSSGIRSSTRRAWTASSAGSAEQPPPRVASPIGLSDMARSLGLPVHRPHHADGDALTTAQAFIALATHLETFKTPPTVGWMEEVSAGGGATAGARGDPPPAPAAAALNRRSGPRP